MTNIQWVDIKNCSDSRGALIVAEGQKNIPFEIKRVYCLSSMTGEPRGFHAHKDLQQVMVCLAGRCKIVLDDGQTREAVELTIDSPGLLISNCIWREMSDFSSDCVLMVLASDWYDENDYIRQYDEFEKFANEASKQ